MSQPTPSGNLSHLLTIALITQNESRNLAACLDSVAPLNCPILMIDSGSTDNTLAIAQQYGAEIHVFRDWQGFGVQRHRAHEFIRTDWVLWLDADERLSETTRQDLIFRLPEIQPDGKTVFSINRLPVAYGREIRHCGWYPDRVVRVYPPKYVRYGADKVHESVQLLPHSKIIDLHGDVLHETYRDLPQHMNKLSQYAWAWAEQAQQSGKKAPNTLLILLKSVFVFVKIYVLKRGFLDGTVGLHIAVMSAIYTFLKYTQLSQKHK